MRPTLASLETRYLTDPMNDAGASAFGLALVATGDHSKGIKCLTSAVQIAPHIPAHYQELAKALTETGDRPKAIALLQKAVARHLDAFPLLLDLGDTLRSEARNEEALQCFTRALRTDPNNIAVLIRISDSLLDGACSKDAFERLGALSPETEKAVLLHAHARALMTKGDYEEAVPFYQQILSLRPHDSLALVALGCIAFVFRDIDTSFKLHTEAYRSRPRIQPAVFFYVFDLCVLGRFQEARRVVQEWKEQGNIYLARVTDYGKPFCDTLTDLRGQTVLLHSDWGFGDAISMVRFAPALVEHGATVIVESHKSICSLLRTVPGVDGATAKYEPCPEFQLECVLDELWLFDSFTLQTLGDGVPYIQSPAQHVDQLRATIPESSQLNVGLCWEGSKLFLNDRYFCRSVPFTAFRDLLNCPGIQYYALARDAVANCPAAASCPNLVNLAPNLADFAQIAAAIQCLDLVVTIDTSFAHLCGAMGKRALVIMPYAPYTWRWFLGRSDSPFYPSLRLFWPIHPGDWSDVLAEVQTEVCAAAARKRSFYRQA